MRRLGVVDLHSAVAVAVVENAVGDQRSNRRHTASPVINTSAAAAMPVINSGVASRYQ
jgi:hypothetical protein